jgi:hypothetical protein
MTFYNIYLVHTWMEARGMVAEERREAGGRVAGEEEGGVDGGVEGRRRRRRIKCVEEGVGRWIRSGGKWPASSEF